MPKRNLQVDSPDSVMVSIRLTAAERRLAEEAAAQKGWKLATFLRNASLERAAHILNLARSTTLNFHGLASQLADQIVGERHASLATEEDTGSYTTFGRYGVKDDILLIDLERAIKNNDVHVAEISPPPLDPETVQVLEDAARLGGAEFLAAVVAECRRRAPSVGSGTPLPPPIDPRNVQD